MIRRDKEYKLKTARNCVKGYPCGATCISAKKVCLPENANYQDLLVLKGLMNAEDVVPVELRAKHSDRTGKQVVDIVLSQTEAITERIAKEQRKLEILRTQYEIAKAKYLRSNPNDTELKGWKANQKLLNRIARVETGIHVLESDRDELTKSIIELPQERRISLAEMRVKPDSEEGGKLLKEAHTTLSRFLDKSLAPSADVLLTENTHGTSYYFPLMNTMFINFSQEQTSSAVATPIVIAHEYIHHLEHHNQELKSVTQAFFKSRTKDEKLSSMFPSRPDIQVKRDKFIHPYMGRVYNDGGMEVLTVGVEYLLQIPFKFMKRDPEHFAFVYDALRGNFAHLKKQYKEFLT
jgi:hypothetical protein